MKRLSTGLLALTCILTVFLSTTNIQAQQSQQAEQLLQAAINKQVVEGDLAAAIEIYENILNRFPSNKPVAAKALVQLGRCYEKLGDEKAREAYERVLRDYGDQSAEAAEARARISALEQRQQPSSPVESGTRKVFEYGSTVAWPRISYDGSFLSYTGRTGDVELYEFSTGEDRNVTNESDLGKENAAESEYAGFGLASIVSPNSKFIAYNWENPETFGWDLRVISVDGTDKQTLLNAPEGAYYHPHDWSPDGQQLLVEIHEKANDPTKIGLVSFPDGTLKIVKTLENRTTLFKMGFSADGRFIAYDYPQEEGSTKGDIYILSVDGTQSDVLIQHRSDDAYMGWEPGGNGLLFSSDRTGSRGAWLQEVRNGRPIGSAKLVKPDLGSIGRIGFTRDGSYYYSVRFNFTDLHIAELNFTTGQLLSSPTSVDPDQPGGSLASWSRNGRYLAYYPPESRSRFGAAEISRPIAVQDVQNRTIRTVWPKINVSISNPIVSNDGQYVYTKGSDGDDVGYFQVNVETGEASLIIPENPDTGQIYGTIISRDDTKLFYRQYISDTECRVLSKDIESGAVDEIVNTERLSLLALSPDDRWLAYYVVETDSQDLYSFTSRLMIVFSAGGEPQEIARINGFIDMSSGWSADGNELRFMVTTMKDVGEGTNTEVIRDTELWRVSIPDGDIRKITLQIPNFGNMSAYHPDGRRIVFYSSEGSSKRELWIMENFLPPVEKN